MHRILHRALQNPTLKRLKQGVKMFTKTSFRFWTRIKRMTGIERKAETEINSLCLLQNGSDEPFMLCRWNFFVQTLESSTDHTVSLKFFVFVFRSLRLIRSIREIRVQNKMKAALMNPFCAFMEKRERNPPEKSNNFERFFGDSTLTFLTYRNTFRLPILPTRRAVLLRRRGIKIRRREILIC